LVNEPESNADDHHSAGIESRDGSKELTPFQLILRELLNVHGEPTLEAEHANAKPGVNISVLPYPCIAITALVTGSEKVRLFVTVRVKNAFDGVTCDVILVSSINISTMKTLIVNCSINHG
jgi:hypothetical protein